MRSDLSLTSNLMSAIATAKRTEDVAVQQLSSGKRLRAVSDDPSASSQLTLLESATSALDSYAAGNGPLRARFAAADSALASGVQLVTRAISLGVQGSNGTLSPEERKSIAAELKGVQDQLATVANAQFNGRYLFGGVKDGVAPFITAGGTMTYQGAQPSSVEISDGVTISNGQAGDALFGKDGNNIFDALNGMMQSLNANLSPQAALASLQAGLEGLITTRVSYGNAMNAIDDTAATITSAKQRITDTIEQLNGADMTTAASQLAQAQVVQSAASAAFAKISGTSLFDYLPR